MHETACIKCNVVSTVPLDVAAPDSLKANLMTQPHHRYLHLIYEFIYFFFLNRCLFLPDATWKSWERPIFVEMDGWRWIYLSIVIWRLWWRPDFLSLRWNLERRIPIRRRRRHVEEHHDRGPIEPRSRRDRAAIVDLAAWNLFHDLRSSFPEHLEHDRCSIVVDRGRSREDRGLLWSSFWSEIQANSARIWSHNAAQCKPLPRRLDSAPMTASITHNFGPISLFKSMYFPLLFFNFWSTREEIKRVSRKVLSSRDPLLPRV